MAIKQAGGYNRTLFPRLQSLFCFSGSKRIRTVKFRSPSFHPSVLLQVKTVVDLLAFPSCIRAATMDQSLGYRQGAHLTLEMIYNPCEVRDRGAVGMDAEISIVNPTSFLRSLICVCLSLSLDPWNRAFKILQVEISQFHTQEGTAILLPQLTALFVYKFFPFLFYGAVVVRLMEA